MNGPLRQWRQRENMALLTDFYELTMIAGYLKEGRQDRRVCFEYFFRSLPPHTGFAVAAGLEPFLNYLEHLRFTKDDLEYLNSLEVFDRSFVDYLEDFRPKCTVRAVPEGTLMFPYEPVVQVEGTIFEAQLVETALLNILNYSTLIATKASRVCQAADGDPVLEFGLRRAHGPDGGLLGSRGAYIGGCSSTSNVLAGMVHGIPVSGTHAHSWVMSFDDELDAFRSFIRHYPDRCVLLVDTYDTLESGVPNAIEAFREAHDRGEKIRAAIRLDSGDLAKLSKAAYRMLTEAGFEDPLIVASNDLEEDLIADLKRQGARINAWGVGTHLITSRDCPSLGGVYKLVAVDENGEWVPRMKTTSNIEKSTDPGRKQIARYWDASGQPIGDVLYDLAEDVPQRGTIVGHHRTQHLLHTRIRDAARCDLLLETVFEDGKVARPAPSIESLRQRALDGMGRMPDEFRRLRNPERYKVALSQTIGHMKEGLLQNIE